MFNVHTDSQTYDLFPKKIQRKNNCVSQTHFILGIITSALFFQRETKSLDFSNHVQIFISLELYFEGYIFTVIKTCSSKKMRGSGFSLMAHTVCLYIFAKVARHAIMIMNCSCILSFHVYSSLKGLMFN